MATEIQNESRIAPQDRNPPNPRDTESHAGTGDWRGCIAQRTEHHRLESGYVEGGRNHHGAGKTKMIGHWINAL